MLTSRHDPFSLDGQRVARLAKVTSLSVSSITPSRMRCITGIHLLRLHPILLLKRIEPFIVSLGVFLFNSLHIERIELKQRDCSGRRRLCFALAHLCGPAGCLVARRRPLLVSYCSNHGHPPILLCIITPKKKFLVGILCYT